MFIYPDNFSYRDAAEFVCNPGLTQLIDAPTRGNNVLDLVYLLVCFVAILCACYLLWESVTMLWFH